GKLQPASSTGTFARARACGGPEAVMRLSQARHRRVDLPAQRVLLPPMRDNLGTQVLRAPHRVLASSKVVRSSRKQSGDAVFPRSFEEVTAHDLTSDRSRAARKERTRLDSPFLAAVRPCPATSSECTRLDSNQRPHACQACTLTN